MQRVEGARLCSSEQLAYGGVRRLSMSIRKVFIYFCCMLLLIGCAHTLTVADSEVERKYLPWLEDGKTKKEEVQKRLGLPSVEFEGGRLWTFRLDLDQEKGFVSTYPAIYSLVLVFDEKSTLKKHSLLRVRP